VERLAWNDQLLASLLEPGRVVQAVDGAGRVARLAIEAREGATIRVQGDGELSVGTVTTARLGEGSDVVFVQLLVERAGDDGVQLRISDAARLPSERWLERSTYRGDASLTVAGRTLAARVLDATPVGVRVAVDDEVAVGEIVILRLGDEVDLQARVLRAASAGAEWELAAEVVGLSQAGWVALERLLEPRDPGVR
jgi:hypothetical protein